MARRHLTLLALFAALALVATACGGDDTETAEDVTETDTGTEEVTPTDTEVTETEPTATATPTDGTEAPAAGENEFSVYICEPESLTPTNTNEVCGAEVLNAVFSGLVEYDLETNEAKWGDDAPRAQMADITTEDQTTWTITLKEGWTWHDGTPVTAQDYVNGWNYGALSTNAQGNSYFFGNIQGYEDLQGEVDDEGNVVSEPAATELSGLTVVDDTTFEVTLSDPFSGFPTTIGYTAFYPAHSSLLEDPDAFNEAPIGQGPFMIEGSWQHDEQVRVVKFEDYGGEPANADAITFRIYADVNTGYNDFLAGNLDVMDSLPPEVLGTAAEELGDNYINTPTSAFNYLGFPLYDERFQDPNLRMAISKAIDRQGIVDAVFSGARRPADAFVSPVVDGYREGACGTACEYDPEEAARLLEEAGGWEGPMTIWFNSGAGHEEWIEVVAALLDQNLGISDVQFESLTFADYLGVLDAQEITGPFRLGWVMDYPSPQNYLEPLHSCDGSSNNTGYCNEEFDNLVQQGNSAASVEEGIEFYNQAEDLLAQDVPIAPIYYNENNGAASDRVEGATIDAFDRVNTADIRVVG